MAYESIFSLEKGSSLDIASSSNRKLDGTTQQRKWECIFTSDKQSRFQKKATRIFNFSSLQINSYYRTELRKSIKLLLLLLFYDFLIWLYGSRKLNIDEWTNVSKLILYVRIMYVCCKNKNNNK